MNGKLENAFYLESRSGIFTNEFLDLCKVEAERLIEVQLFQMEMINVLGYRLMERNNRTYDSIGLRSIHIMHLFLLQTSLLVNKRVV